MKNMVFNMDCMIFLEKCIDNQFDLAIVDPPYGIDINMNMGRKKGKKKRHNTKTWDKFPPDKKYFDELFRVSKNQIIWGGNYFALPTTKSWIFWDKCVPDGVSFSDGELAWTSFDRTLKKLVIKYSGFTGLDPDGRIHPTQKPILLYRTLLEKYAKPGDSILDTHVGSGSSRIAAYDLGFDFTGVEFDVEYFLAQEKRFNEYKKQIKLF